MTDESSPEVLVVGSINLDLSLRVERFPDSGETVLGQDLLRSGGGKGANQAVAAARLGRRVAMVGAVGGDDVGGQLLSHLEAEGIDVAAVEKLDGLPTGLAVIEVDDDGENRIVVITGANGAISGQQAERAADLIAAAPVVLVQLEIPVSVVNQLATMKRSGLLVLNPAPASAEVDLSAVDILIPNRGELAALAGGTISTSTDELIDQVRALPSGPSAVVVTVGGDGALVVTGLSSGTMEVEQVDALPVTAVDTTAAGDAFCAAVADALCLGADVGEATRWAVRVAAVTVTRRGAQQSLPHRSELVS